MAKKRYQRPPIVEVRCEAVVTGGQWTDETPFHLRAHLLEQYPRQVSAPAKESRARLIVSRKDDSQTVQFFPHKVIVSQLRPYPGFRVLSSSVLDMVALHREVMGSARVERIGIRYVNRIALPNPHMDVSRYLKVESSRANGFRRRMILKPLNPGHKLVATAGSSHSSRAPFGVVLLDIHDYLDAGDCGDIPNLAACLEEVHQNVEDAFERLVTDEARQTFEEQRV